MAANLMGMAFMPYYRHIMDVLETNRDLKKTAKGIFHQACYGAAGTAVGGVVGGPPGALVGGIVGAIWGYRTVETYDSMLEVIRGLTDQEKAELVQKIQELIGSSSLEALTAFIAGQVNREIFLNLIREFTKQTKSGG